MHYSTKSTSLNQARATLNQVLITFPLLVGGAKTRCVCEPDQTLFSATTNKNGKKRSGHARLGRPVVRRNKGRFKNFWNPTDRALLGIYGVLRRYSVIVVLPMYFSRFFRVTHIMEARKSGTPCFSCRSLLLSTTVLNDRVWQHVTTCHIELFTLALEKKCVLVVKPWPEPLRLVFSVAGTSD